MRLSSHPSPFVALALSLVAASCNRSGGPVAGSAETGDAGGGAAAGGVSCEALEHFVLPHVSIRSARGFPPAAATGEAPAVPASCRVQGTSRPTADSEIRFEIAVPAGAAWNGRYLQVGNGGFAGSIPEDDILEGLAAGFAVAGTDDGHQSSSGLDSSWALGHPEKVVDFGYRAIKETTDAARALIRAHTGRAPSRSYFQGCSDGGREALMETQRYPDDFDGVVAGAPANHWTHLFVGAAWAEQALLASPASYVPAAKLKALEDAALAACGDADGVVEDPLACRFDPAVLRCKAAESDRCLTDAQIKTVRAIYAGPKNPRTSGSIMAGYEPGSEAENGGWQSWMVGRAPGADGGAAMYLLAKGFFANLMYGDAGYDFRRLTFDADVAALDAKLAPILDANDPDLGPFQKHGGKLIQYHGWGDAAVPPRDSVRYHDAVQAKMGDVADFYRLFMAPGMLHCGGGRGPSVIATLPAIVDWVENGNAPGHMIATRPSGEGPGARVDRSRPLCPYPQLAIYDGKGPRERAESYACGAPAGRPPVCAETTATPSSLDPSLAPPGAPRRVVAHAAASGTQNYVCSASHADAGGGFAWTFAGPEATLADCEGSALGRHFANDAGAPEWEARDGSFVVAKKIAAVPSKEPGAVPWLLLEVTSSGGSGVLGGVAHVQRTTTSGGATPSGGCDAAHAGAVAKVPYSADYWFLGK